MKIQIDSINNFGVGNCDFGKNKIFVPFSLSGEELEVEITEQSTKFTKAKIKKIISPSQDRINPKCEYFGKCGGCNLQHMNHNSYVNFKKNLLEKAFKYSNLDLDKISDFIIVGEKQRRRANLKAVLVNNILYMGFLKDDSNEIVPINNCLILKEELNSLLPEIASLINKFNPIIIAKTPIEIFLTSCVNGIDILIKSNHLYGPNEVKLLSSLVLSNVIRISWQIDDNYKVIFQKEEPEISFYGQKLKIPSEVFLQATEKSQEIMIDFVLKYSKNTNRIIDLFSGIGTFAIPMSLFSKIHGVELDKKMSLALKNYSSNITSENRDLFKKPFLLHELNKYDMIVMNPPRAGAEMQAREISKSQVKKIMLISCDLRTYARDAKILIEGGYKQIETIAIDQFYYTPHLEVMTFFTK